GTLTAALINSFTPTVGQTFTILTASSVTGTFTNSTIAINSSEHFNVSYTATSVVLTVASGPVGTLSAPATSMAAATGRRQGSAAVKSARLPGNGIAKAGRQVSALVPTRPILVAGAAELPARYSGNSTLQAIAGPRFQRETSPWMADSSMRSSGKYPGSQDRQTAVTHVEKDNAHMGPIGGNVRRGTMGLPAGQIRVLPTRIPTSALR
ncbi:MAG TPA: hypothetical protein VND65_04380, partial [Candidatus Binatia bacterium]|nr:hypothetical protein [Candidatus Binatia bacterium]